MQVRMQDLAYKLQLVLEWCEGVVHALKIPPPQLPKGLHSDIPILVSEGPRLAAVEDSPKVAVMEVSPAMVMTMGSPAMVNIDMEVEPKSQPLAQEE